jgi:hypothetical protein
VPRAKLHELILLSSIDVFLSARHGKFIYLKMVVIVWFFGQTILISLLLFNQAMTEH